MFCFTLYVSADPSGRVGVLESHFVYHLPEVIVRRNALLVKSQTRKCQVGGGRGRGGGDPWGCFSRPGVPPVGLLGQGLADVRRFSNVFPISASRIRQSRNNKQCFGQEYVNLATITNVPETKYMTLGPKFFC